MDVTGNMNPFLFDDPAPPPTGEESEVGNPFLNGGAFDFSASSYSGVNPFSDQIDETSASAVNIFGDQTTYAPEKNPFECVPETPSLFNPNNEQVVADVDFFGSAPAQEDAPVDIFGAPAPQPPKPPPPRPPSPSKMAGGPDTNNFAKPPPPRPPPPSKETKDLLQTVIGAMEATTDTLQYKLNTTVTPCPSPSGGQHSSRSPTPDIQITAPEKEPDAFSTIFGQTIELSDQECDETASKPKVPEAASEPVQPAVSSESAPSATAASTEEFDLFGEVLPQSKPKTTQDILSLFNKPATTSSPQQVDLLSDDLISASDVPEGQEKEEISDSSAFDLLSSGQETAPDICANKDVSSLDDSSAFPELAATEVDAHPSEVVVSPDTTSEKTISEPDISEVAPQKQQEQIQPHPPDEVEPKPELPKSESEPLELGAAQTEQENKDLSADVKASDESWNITEASKPESETIPLESLATEQIAPEEIFGVPTTIPEQIINQEPPQETVSEVSPPAINDAFVAVEPPIAPIDTKTLENVFGNTAEPEPLSPSPFFNIPENIAPHPTPSSATSTGFDLFGEVEVGPSSPQAVVTSVAETTGATLFETETPAPNVGMSLFGAGEEASLDIFAESAGNTMINPFAPTTTAPASVATLASVTEKKINEATDEEFDAFSARFENVSTVDTIEPAFDPFTAGQRAASPWGEGSTGAPAESFGFGDDAKFDPFLALNEPPPPPQSTPRKIKRDDSRDSDETPMNVIIRPAAMEDGTPVPLAPSPVPVLAPPPAVVSSAFTDSTPRFNPFDKSGEDLAEAVQGVTAFPGQQGELQRSESQETPPTPLFEEDQSVPLEPFPRTIYDGRTWEMHLRQPNKKKITGQRFWKKVFVKLTNAGALQLYNTQDDKEPFQELPLQPCYSVSDIGAQQFDQFGKIFTVKIQYIFYKERPGVRPGQISKAERITNKLSKFAQYAIAGDYEGVKEFASDVRKLGMPVEHAPQISQLLKLGTQTYEDLKLFASLIEEFMFKLTVHRDRALTYKSEEVQLTAVDEMYVEQDLRGAVTHMVARVRIFFLGFLTGMPEVDLGINDLRKQGHEVVGRHDIIPVITEEWIRLEDIEFHCTVNQEEFESTRHIKFKPPDACYIELMRFRVRPPKNRELPLQVKTKFIILGKRVEIQCEILVPGFSGRKLGQVPCEDVALRFPLPECWIYMFRVEKHFRYGSVKSAHRRTGKVKGIERLKGTVEAPDATLMEVTSGQAKYEHQHRAIVWRMSRLPKEGQGAYSVHQFTCKMNLTDYDQIPSTLDRFCVLEFTMPATTVSHCVMRSVSVTSEEPPEKYVRYLARHEYKIEIEFSSESSQNEYLAATMVKPKAEEKDTHQPATLQEESSSDDSS